jgi:magnesium-transporting ATPase (P-type)
VRHNWNDKAAVEPDLAKSWEISPDGKVYTFHLYEGVKWHDGQPFTAEDVKYSLEKMADRTLTEGVVKLHSALNVEGRESEKVLFYAYLNAFYETGFKNPIDVAIRNYRQFDLSGFRKLDEVPYDFIRKRLSILVSNGGAHLMVTKGALLNVLSVCKSAETSEGDNCRSRQGTGSNPAAISGT